MQNIFSRYFCHFRLSFFTHPTFKNVHFKNFACSGPNSRPKNKSNKIPMPIPNSTLTSNLSQSILHNVRGRGNSCPCQCIISTKMTLSLRLRTRKKGRGRRQTRSSLFKTFLSYNLKMQRNEGKGKKPFFSAL